MKAQQELEQLILNAIENGSFPGANYAIIFKNKIIYGSHGYKALYPEKEVNDIDTIYDMASLSKVISTTTCALKLIEEGKDIVIFTKGVITTEVIKAKQIYYVLLYH